MLNYYFELIVFMHLIALERALLNLFLNKNIFLKHKNNYFRHKNYHLSHKNTSFHIHKTLLFQT